ncbi:beta-lactamase family protein [Flavobacteriaceae bacterium F89]|uniref:Beta-lactamase family protein n=1 Tax=Cerina litoralis TaxID=2874477 RepID=A0AAE3EWX0_9FLAO|nr:serine hydrolase [Cerina litoralis]MCG2461619.1 beta-lactamase family protein [Cerina litoralis]
MESKNRKVLNAICPCKYLIGPMLLLLLFSCSENRNNWEGIWRTEIEYIPGLHSNFEFELSQALFSGEWSGRWETDELLAHGEIPKVKVAIREIEMNFGVDGQFRGHLSEEKRTLEGILYGSDGKNDTLKFVKVDGWTSERPARINENGDAIKHWSYRIPESTGDGWNVADLKNFKISQQPLDELFQNVVDGQYKGLDAVLIAHNGQLVLEEYFHLGAQNRVHTIQSCTKSVTSLLIGIANDNGLISDLDLPLQSFFTNYLDTLNTNTWPVSLKHALTMSAGLEWNEEDILYTNPKNDAVRMNQSSDMYSFVLKRNMADEGRPGNQFEYNSGLSVLLGGVLLDVTGIPADRYAEKTLFNRLGIKHYNWQSLTDKVHTGGGLWLRPRDFLKIGQLVLDNGKWNGQQIISESWIEESTAFQLPIKESNDWGYGYQWWRGIFHVGQTKFPEINAAGYGGQFLFVVPDLDLVVLFLHHNPADLNLSHTLGWKEMEKYIVPAVLSN